MDLDTPIALREIQNFLATCSDEAKRVIQRNALEAHEEINQIANRRRTKKQKLQSLPEQLWSWFQLTHPWGCATDITLFLQKQWDQSRVYRDKRRHPSFVYAFTCWIIEQLASLGRQAKKLRVYKQPNVHDAKKSTTKKRFRFQSENDSTSISCIYIHSILNLRHAESPSFVCTTNGVSDLSKCSADEILEYRFSVQNGNAAWRNTSSSSSSHNLLFEIDWRWYVLQISNEWILNLEPNFQSLNCHFGDKCYETERDFISVNCDLQEPCIAWGPEICFNEDAFWPMPLRAHTLLRIYLQKRNIPRVLIQMILSFYFDVKFILMK